MRNWYFINGDSSYLAEFVMINAIYISELTVHGYSPNLPQLYQRL